MTVVKIVPMPGPSSATPANTGDITFNQVDIIGAGTASGDGSGYSTINLVPDVDLKSNGQYVTIDPTAPNHIHIRAGGTQDASNAQLILGGEQANVIVTDYNHQVQINSYNAETDEYHSWTFGSDGVIYPPVNGFNVYGGATGSFISQDAKLITVTNGIITNIEEVP